MKLKFNLVCLMLAAFFLNELTAQPVLKKQKTAGGSLIETLNYMTLTRDGGIIAGGFSNSNASGEKTANSKGLTEFWIIKADSKGSVQWDKTIGGSGGDWLAVIKQTSDGGYILGGVSSSDVSGDKTENSKGNYDFWIIKTDSLCNIEWNRTIGTNTHDDNLTTIIQTRDGGFIAGGYTEAGISGDKTDINRGFENDWWLVKLNSSGTVEWDKTIGGSGDDYLNSIRETADGYMLAGRSGSLASGEKSQNRRASDYDYWVVRVDSLGNKIWDKTIGGNYSENMECDCLIQTADGNFLISGSSESDIGFEKTENAKKENPDRAGAADFWLVKFDGNGNILWDKTIGSYGADFLKSANKTKDGGFILGGMSSANISADKTENSRGFADYWVVKVDSLGNIIWDKTIGGLYDDILTGVNQVKNNSYIVGGYTFSGATGDKNQPSRGSYDYWFVVLQEPASIAADPSKDNIIKNVLNTKAANTFSVFPNPAKDILYINQQSKSVFTLINQSGRIVLSKTINGNDVLNVSSLPAGIYYLKKVDTNETKKIIITK